MPLRVSFYLFTRIPHVTLPFIQTWFQDCLAHGTSPFSIRLRYVYSTSTIRYR